MLSPFRKVSQIFCSIAFITTLSACGGGGGGGGDSSSSPSTPASAVFPIADAYASQVINGFSNSISVTGQVNDKSYSGTGSFSLSPATSGSFENQTGLLANVISLTATVSVGGTSQSINSSATSYSDSNYNPLGSIDSSGYYSVVMSSSPLPTAAHVNDTGPISTSTTYTDSTKITVDSTTVDTYAIEPDTETSVIYDVIGMDYDTNHALLDTTHERYRVTTSGAVTFVSFDLQSADGSYTEHVVPQ